MEFPKFYVEFSSLVRFGGSVRFLTKNGRKFGSAGFPTMPRFGLSLFPSTIVCTLGIQVRNMKMVFKFYGTWRRVTFEKLMMKT